jgi:hypothetical protein
MTGKITLLSAGLDTGPFNLFSDVTSFNSAFEVNVSRNDLLNGYPSNLIPNGTTIVRVMSIGNCTNYLDINIS